MAIPLDDPSKQKPLKSLLHSRAVVEIPNYVSTGVVNYLEGDIMEIELGQLGMFKLGMELKLSLYTVFGLFVIESVILAITPTSIIALNPTRFRKQFSEKRDTVRVPIAEQVPVKALIKGNGKLRIPVVGEVSVQLDNISLGGVGFYVPKDAENLLQSERLELELNFQYTFPATYTVVQRRAVTASEQVFVGGQLVAMSQAGEQKLRSYIIHRQINDYYGIKQKSQQDELLKRAILK